MSTCVPVRVGGTGRPQPSGARDLPGSTIGPVTSCAHCGGDHEVGAPECPQRTISVSSGSAGVGRASGWQSDSGS